MILKMRIMYSIYKIADEILQSLFTYLLLHFIAT